ncbi:hypothetical protein HHK36_026972 [Tetracentron sinense]|uniref:DEAD-box ATP-dependent RNA helicase 13 n=1 Tax=Tetracentron sinense TaxID=13715 RepID=A0A835D349_TETSI|nr:hypothetical protein HHK36_026972 [Tetracentron sinense]
MAAKASSSSSHSLRKKSKKKTADNPEVERLNALPWDQSFSNDDPFVLSVGTDDLEGGFLSLEEIDESEYGIQIPKPGKDEEKKEPPGSLKSKKRKCKSSDGGSGYEFIASSEEKVEDEKKAERKKKKKKKAKKKKDGDLTTELGSSNSSFVAAEQLDGCGKDDVEGQLIVDEAEFYAWNELRLHPMLMKSIYRLGFKEPTPIQKACIPAGSHQGKDVIGAAETGSGKTLAFGLPILQRLLEEQEKAANLFSEKEDAGEKSARGSPLRALIVTPTRELALQVTDHIKEVAKVVNIRVVPIVGGMSTEKQERLLRARPEIVVGTPGRLWELMSGGDRHLVELHSLSFFVLDEADRMIEHGHFHELQSIIDMLPMTSCSVEGHSQITQNGVTVSNFQRKKRQTFVFSATIALSADFRKKLKRGSLKSKQSMSDGMSSIETLSERAGMKADAAIIDLTNASIMADKLEESFIECREEDKDASLYYILSVYGQGRTIVFCTSIAALRHISSLLRILGISVWTLHAQMQQRARLKRAFEVVGVAALGRDEEDNHGLDTGLDGFSMVKEFQDEVRSAFMALVPKKEAIDRFRGNEHGILVATDVAARGLDIPGVRTVVHYQLPHSAEVYVHRSGRTARASADGCSIALISPTDRSKFASLCKSFSKESLHRFPLDNSYMPEVVKRLSLARQIDKISRKDSQEKANKSWFERNAESVELVVEDYDSDEGRVNNYKEKKISSIHLKKLQQELNMLLSCPLQPQTFSHRFLAGAGVSPLLQHQFEELARQKLGDNRNSGESKRRKLVVIGQDCMEPLQALRNVGHEVCLDVKETAEKRRNMENIRRKRKDEKKRLHDQRRKERKRLKNKSE